MEFAQLKNYFDEFWRQNASSLRICNDRRTCQNYKKLLNACFDFADLDLKIAAYRNGRETMRRITVAFYEYIQKQTGIRIESTLYAKRFFNYSFERQLEIAKYLHEPHSGKEIAEKFDIDTRTMRADIEALRNGIEVLGTDIQIREERHGRKIYYRSTLHPVFLPLNLSELYALTVYMPRMVKRLEPNTQIIEDIVSCIKSQLSDYAKSRLFPDEEWDENPGRVSYRDDEKLAKSREGIYMYLRKSGRQCSFFLNGEKKIGSIVYQDGKERIRLADGSICDVSPNEVEFIIDELEYR